MDAQARIEKVLEQFKRGLLTTQETRLEILEEYCKQLRLEPRVEPEFTSRDLMTISSTLAEFRKELETREGLDMTKLEIYRVHKMVHDKMKVRGIHTLPVWVYTHPLEVQS